MDNANGDKEITSFLVNMYATVAYLRMIMSLSFDFINEGLMSQQLQGVVLYPTTIIAQCIK